MFDEFIMADMDPNSSGFNMNLFNPDVFNTNDNLGQVGGPAMTTPPVVTAPYANAQQELSSNIVRIAKNLNINPVDLATVISYETGGTFNPDQKGPVTPQWGQHQGLIQWGERGAGKDYGYKPGMSITAQMDLVERYLTDRGFKPGGNMMDLYSTINAGGPGLYNRSDANVGGAPGTVADKVNNQMAGHKLKAAALLSGTLGPDVVSRMANTLPARNPAAENAMTTPMAKRGPMMYPEPAALADPMADPGPVQASAGVDELRAMLEDEGSPAMPMPGELSTIPIKPPSFLENLTAMAKTGAVNVGDSVMTAAKDIGRGAKIAGGEAQGAITSLPFMLGGMAHSIPALAGSKADEELATRALTYGQKMRDAARYQWGTLEDPEPKTPFQSVAAAAGRSAGVPASLPVMGAMATADVATQALNKFVMPAQAAKFSAAERAQMKSLLGPTQGENALLPGPRMPVVTHNEAPIVIETPAGPTTLPGSSVKTMGWVGIATLGMMVSPFAIRAVQQRYPTLPVFNPMASNRPVMGAPGTFTTTNVKDLARTFDDVNAPLFNAAYKAGVPVAEVQAIKDKFRLQTGVATRSLSDSAVVNGQMNTPSFIFQVRTPLQNVQMFERANPTFTQYIQNHVLADIAIAKHNRAPINQNTGQRAMPPIGGANFGPDVRPPDLLNAINTMNRTHPEYPRVFQQLQENILEGRRFISNGRYAIEQPGTVNMMNRYFGSTPSLTRRMSEQMMEKMQRGMSPTEVLAGQFHEKFRQRMVNEARGELVNAMSRANNGRFMTPRTKDWVDAHKGSDHTIVRHFEYGKPVYHTTDPLIASIMKSDPYFFHGTLDGLLFGTKKVFEATTTGVAAPNFAWTNLARAQVLALASAKPSMKAPMPWDVAAAIPYQYVPDMAKVLADKVNVSSNGWIGSVIGQQNMQAFGDRMSRVYQRSLQGQLAVHGGHRGTWTGATGTDAYVAFREQSRGMTKAMMDVIPTLPPGSWARSLLSTWSKGMDSMYDAVNFAYIKKNRTGGKNLHQLVTEGRDLTGSPTTTGQWLTGANGQMFKYQPANRVDSVAAAAVQTYGLATELGRTAIPWWNPTTQGMKRLGQAYWENPVRFGIAVYGTAILPSIINYNYTRSLGKDPQGVSYIEHMMEGRSPYDSQMTLPFYLPGRPVADAIKWPLVHELSPAVAFTLHGMDQMYGRSAHTPGEMFGKVAGSFAGLMDPPVPPGVNAVLGGLGIGQAQGGIFGTMFGKSLGIPATGHALGGEPFKKRSDPFDQLGGMEGAMELQMRALAPGFADIFASFVTSFLNADEHTNAVKAGMQSGTRKAVERTPFVRDVVGWKPPVSGQSVLSEELYKKNNAIKNLSKYIEKNITNEGAINIKPQSVEGGAVVNQWLGPGLPPDPEGAGTYLRGNKKRGVSIGDKKPDEWANSPGVYQPEPSNKLFKDFAVAVNARFQKDEPAKGGFGYKSFWRRHADYTEAIGLLGKVNDGNAVSWQIELNNHPEWVAEFKKAKINYLNPREARNYLTLKRLETGRLILNSIRAVEQEFGKMPEVQALTKGKPFKIEMVDPYSGADSEPQ